MKKVNYIFVLVSVLTVIVLGIGVSYSLWNISVSQDKVNMTMTSCFDITYSSESNAINLEKQYPISDEAGSKLTPYTFKITNNCDINAYYKINLETLNTSNIDTRLIKASLNNTNPQVINRYNETEVSLKNGKVANTLKSGYLPVGGSISFDLRVWLDYDTTINDIKNDGTDKWVGKIVVISSPVTEDEINKVCQSSGGDLIDSGECRKYYVRLNQQFNLTKSIIIGYESTEIDNSNNSFSLKHSTDKDRFFPMKEYTTNNIYYIAFKTDINTVNKNWFSSQLMVPKESYPKSATKYDFDLNDFYYYYYIKNGFNSYLIFSTHNGNSIWYFENYTTCSFNNYETIDLTLMFGEGNEPTKEWCDKYLTDYFKYNKEGTLTPIKEIGEPIKTAYYDKVDMFD